MIMRLLIVGLLLLTGSWGFAQEMNFSVKINTPQLQTVDPIIFSDLKSNLENFLNNQKWTNDVFEQNERIKCNIQINIKEEKSATSFGGELQIQAVRPVHGSNYETVLLSHADKDFVFSYEQFQPLQYTKNDYVDNLTSVMSFYVYIILGLDYDSFSPYGGEEFFQEAQLIVNTVPPGAAAVSGGWRARDSNRNRFWMIESILNPRARKMRKSLYDYHRQGLDAMVNDVLTSRAIIANSITEIEQVSKAYPNAMAVQMFANAKGNEIVEIFKKGDGGQKSQVKRSMIKIDAANASKYRQIGS